MAEYIDRDSLITDMRKRFCEDCDRRKGEKNGKARFVYDIGDAPCRACWVDDAICEVEDYPSADVRPVVHGKWIIKNDDFMGYPTVCSVCGRDAITSAWRPVKTPYCPYCGAKLDGKCAN